MTLLTVLIVVLAAGFCLAFGMLVAGLGNRLTGNTKASTPNTQLQRTCEQLAEWEELHQEALQLQRETVSWLDCKQPEKT